MFTKKERGFTLIELMIVVAIIGILAAVAVPKFADLIDKAKEASAKSNLGAIRSAITIYYGSMEGMAPAADGTSIPEALVTAGGNMSRIPSTEIPFVNSSGGGFTIGENAPTVSVKYDTSNLGAGNESASNESFAYDPGEVELWLAVTGVDTKGVGIHQW